MTLRTELYVLRHGETVWNAAGRMQGGKDSPLTEQGRAQASALGRLLARRGVSVQSHAILTSPQGRARHSAALVLAELPGGDGVAPVSDPRLREIGMGEWAGLALTEIALRWPGPRDEALLDFYARAPGGEGLDALWHRVGDMLADLDRPAVIVTHGMTSRFLRTRALGWPRAALDRLPGGQGCAHHVAEGRHMTLWPEGGVVGDEGLEPPTSSV